MNRKAFVLLASLIAVGTVMAGPRRGRPCGGPRGGFGHRPPPPSHHVFRPGFGHRPPPRFRHAPLHRHVSCWGRGGRGFWPAFAGGVVGGVVGGVLTDAVVGPSVTVTTPTVVTQPAVVVAGSPVVVSEPACASRRVWVPGRYVDEVLPDGSVIRVFRPGHYEMRTVQVR